MAHSSSRRETLRILSALAAAAALPKSSLFAALRRQADEEVVPFTDVPEDFSTRRGEFVFRLDLRELRDYLTANED